MRHFLIYSLIFFAPWQLGTYFFMSYSYMYGIPVDYLAPKLFLSDIIGLLLIIFSYQEIVIFYKRYGRYVIGFIIIAVINSYIAQIPTLTIYNWLHLTCFTLIFIAVKNSKAQSKIINLLLLLGAVLQLILVLQQQYFGHSLQGLWYYMGERLLSISTPDVAKVALWGSDMLRAYGSFSHPNSFGGFYTLILYYALIYCPRSHLNNLLIVICGLLITLSFSKVAIIAMILILLYCVTKTHATPWSIATLIFISILAFVTAASNLIPTSLSERITHVSNALMIIARYPLFGVGLGNYTSITAVTSIAAIPQPVHNIFLLLTSELGIIACFGIIYSLIRYLPKKLWLYVGCIMFLGMFDHYLLTLQQNGLSVALLLACIHQKNPPSH
jgi:hypothetical protein